MEFLAGQYLYHGTNVTFDHPQDGTYFGLNPTISIFILIEKIHNELLNLDSDVRLMALQTIPDVTLQTYVIVEPIRVEVLDSKLSHIKPTNIWSGFIDWEDCDPIRSEIFVPTFEQFLEEQVFNTRFYFSALMVPEPEIVLFGNDINKISLVAAKSYNSEDLYRRYWRWELELAQEWHRRGIKRNIEERRVLLDYIANDLA